MRINPDLAEAHGNLGAAYVDLGNLDLAIREYKEALSISLKLTELHYILGCRRDQRMQKLDVDWG